MKRRLFSILATCAVGSACCLAGAAATRAEEPETLGMPAISIVSPDEASAPAAASHGGNYDVSSCIQSCCEPRGTRLFVSGEYLRWWLKDSPQPVPLVTSVPAALVPPGGITPAGVSVGSLLDSNATVVLGGQDIDTNRRSGARFTVGTWVDDHQRLGFEGSYFFITPTTVTQSVAANGSADAPLLSIPFFDVTGQATPNGLPGEAARPIASPPVFTLNFPAAIPGETAGVFTQRLESRMQGFELNALLGLSPWPNGCGFRLEAIGGFRYLNLRESLAFSSAINSEPLGFPVICNTLDQFTTRNDFYGGQLGLRGEYRLKRIVVQASAKVALGEVHQQVTIDGSTVTNLINGPQLPPLNYAGGIFAQPSNIGTHGRDQFAVLPQVDVNVGYQVFKWARVFVGYSFLYLSDVVRPGNQIDRGLNVTRIPFNTDPAGPAFVPDGVDRPAFSFRDSSFWAQGISFGLELRY